MASGLPSGFATMSPRRPFSPTCSRAPPTSLRIAGSPVKIASIEAMDQPSKKNRERRRLPPPTGRIRQGKVRIAEFDLSTPVRHANVAPARSTMYRGHRRRKGGASQDARVPHRRTLRRARTCSSASSTYLAKRIETRRVGQATCVLGLYPGSRCVGYQPRWGW